MKSWKCKLNLISFPESQSRLSEIALDEAIVGARSDLVTVKIAGDGDDFPLGGSPSIGTRALAGALKRLYLNLLRYA